MKTHGSEDRLAEIQNDIDVRVDAIRGGHPDWPCRMGCDGCCRRLAEIPRLTETEWTWLRAGLEQLPSERLAAIIDDVVALSGQGMRPIVCPLLDRSAGACMVYRHRPVACRTYGYYVQRDLGLYCKEIEGMEAEGMLSGVVWGNQDAVELRLRDLGECRDLTEWFSTWKNSAGEVRPTRQPVFAGEINSLP